MRMRSILHTLTILIVGAGFGLPASAQGVLNGGFLGTYYANANLSGAPSFQRRDVRLDFTWGSAGAGGSSSPEYAAVGSKGLSVSWSGSVVPTTSETYSFAVKVSGGSLNLSIRPTGGSSWTSLIADSGGTSQRTDRASFAMAAGHSYDLQIRYAQPAALGGIHLSWSSPTVATHVIEPATPLGLNIGYAGPNDPNLIFADAIKQSYGFQIYNDHTDASHPAKVDANGWPMQDATLPIWTSHSEPGGTYNLRFNGQAQVVDWLGAGNFSSGGKSYGAILPSGVGFDPTTNTTSVSWTIAANAPPKAIWFGFGATRRVPGSAGGTGITKVALLRPLALNGTTSHAPGELFTSEFKTLLGRFSAIRFMDYLATLNNEQVTWADRIKPTDWSQYQPTNGYGYQGKGGAWEYLVELANETGKDVWINIPLNANDDYVTKVAQLLAYGSDGTNPYTAPQAAPVYPPLNSNLRVYIEYSNEIWNAYFLQHQQLRNSANAEVKAGNSPLNYDGTTDASIWFKRRIAERIKQISDLFRGVWGSPAMLTTIRPVDEFEYGDAGAYGQVGLNFLDAYYNNGDGIAHVPNPVPVNSYIWGAGGGWYTTINNDGATSVSAMYGSGLSMSVISSTITDANLARAFGLHVVGYEGGFSIGNTSGSTSATQQALQLSANYASAAAGMESQTINLFYHDGGELPFAFNSVGGTYGVAGPTLHEQNTPKLAGIAAAIAQGPAAPLIGQAAPATLPVSTAALASGSTAKGGTLAQPAQYIDWTINLAARGNFTVATDTATPAAQVIYVDGVPVGSGPWTGPLTKGLHGIRIQDVASGGMTLRNLKVTAAP
ncbi:MAG: Fibronectin type domain protein [Rhodospirillales bacterium]|nr:Fibronectin type domain protein [Rhodospirillales bacterium]